MRLDERKEIALKGVGASAGVAIGRAYLVDRSRVKVIYQYLLDENKIEEEVDRFRQAVDRAEEQLRQIKEEIPEEIKDHAGIIDAHRLILRDRLIFDSTIDLVRSEQINAEWALKKNVEKAQDAFARIKDEYLRSRVKDVEDVSERILRNLTGKKTESLLEFSEPVIIVSHDLSPADTTQMRLDKVLGFATDMGGKTSHTAIIAQSLGIPAVVGLERITHDFQSGDVLILDGNNGEVIINPDAQTIADFTERKSRYENFRAEIARYSHLPAETLDGQAVTIQANIELMEELDSALDSGAEGIGLFRTEFLYLSQKGLPDEQTLFENFREVARRFAPAPVTIRTLDIGGDKFSSQLDLADEMNPALGLRAIRFCLKELDIFKRQLRAILRASSYGRLKIMFPMISDLDEVRQAKAVLEEVREGLKREGVIVAANIPIGIMIEIPSAVALADHLAKEVDFFSIGTNDLIQYSLAIDRVNEHVAHMYQPLHPAILRLVHQTIKAGHQAGIPVAMCGEMAGDPLYIPVLLGLGLNELSMNPVTVARVKQVIRLISWEESRRMVQEVLTLKTTDQVNRFVRLKMSRGFPELFGPNGKMLY
ncbi:MAG: phosphoenolpyruvate--protein phosphotransferase [Deltaproteobacteria bacterium]|nr:phosphoenolpyruvate--protein phosphotransferase [Deltaproteobacteria bacterium]